MTELMKNSAPDERRKCYDCGKTMFGRRENYNYSECGLRSVVLLNILVFHCECGTMVPEIPAPGELHVSIAMAVLTKKTLLSGEELRFVRKVAGYSATEFSEVIGLKNTSLSHIENGNKKVSKNVDRLVRLVSFARTIENITGSDSGLAESMSRIARVTKDLNLTTVLQKIENRFEGSKSVKINPEYLEGFGLGMVSEVQGQAVQ